MAGLQDLSNEELLALRGRSSNELRPPWAAQGEPASGDLSSLSDEQLLALRGQSQPPAAVDAPKEEPSTAVDMAKQAGAGLVKGVENIATSPAHIANLAGRGADWLLNKFAPGVVSPEAAQNQETLRSLAAANSGGGIEQYLPKPETTAGQYVRSAAEVVPQALALKGGLAGNAAMGAATGLGSEAGGQAFKDTAAEPYARIAGGLAGGYLGGKTAQALATRAAKAGVQAPPDVEALKSAATPVYEELKTTGNAVVLPPTAGKEMAMDIGTTLHPRSLRPANSERTYSQLKDLSHAKDLNDVAIVRDNLRDVANGIASDRIARVKGSDSTAARSAMKQLDTQMDNLSPGWTAKMAEADSNWAAARRIETVQKEASKGKKGRLGTFDSSESRVKGYTREEIAAIKRAQTGGTAGAALDAVGAALNPLHGGYAPALQLLTHAAVTPWAGGTNWLAYAAGAPFGMAADAGAKALKNRAFRQAVSKLGGRSALGQSPEYIYTSPPGQIGNSLLLNGLQAPRLLDQ